MDIQEVGVGLDIKYIRMIYAIGGTYLERIQHYPNSYHIYSAPMFGKRSAVPRADDIYECTYFLGRTGRPAHCVLDFAESHPIPHTSQAPPTYDSSH